jgi:RNA polymerase sigma-70 factor (ECF subfamily)
MSGVEFNQLMITNADHLKPFALSLTRDNESARDLFQETIYRAMVNRDKYNPGTNLKAWMYTIMRNIFINDYRRKARHKTIFDNSPSETLIDYNQNRHVNQAESNLKLKEISKIINSLPEIFKIPFKMYFDGYRYNEISAVLEEPLGTIKSRIHFARKLLKAQLNRYD